MSDVSMEMIQSTAFHEMLPMQTTTVCALWSQLKQAIDFEWLVLSFILLHEKFLQFDWLRAVVFQLNLKYLHVKITNLLRVVV